MYVAPVRRRAKPGHDLREKENQLAQLEVQLAAQTAQSSLLHSRLTSTVDAMDALKLEHEQELAAHKQAKDNARDKLRRFMEYASSVEQERDDCRDALLTLVEKVEENNNLSIWPYSRMRLPEFLEPIPNDAQVQPPTRPAMPETGAGEHAKAIAVWLRAELEKERMSHARTHEQAEREILALRAQLACREAELEACVVHPDHAALLNTTAPEKTGGECKTQQRVPTLSPEDAVEILGLRVAKNRVLESEIKHLSEKLHQARMENGKSVPEQPMQTPLEPTGEPTPKSPHLRPLSPQDILSPYAMTPRYSSTPHGPATYAHLPARPSSLASESIVKGALTEIQKLEEEVRGLAVGIEVLESQRRLTRAQVEQTHTRSASPLAHSEAEEDVSSQHTAVQHEPDCAVPDTETALRTELERVRNDAAQREAELLTEIARLQEELSRQFMSTTPAVGSLLDDDDEEKSMDLGSPLAPVTVLCADGGDTVTMILQQGDLRADACQDDPKAVPVAEGVERIPVTEEIARSNAYVDMSLLIPLPPSPTPNDPSPSDPRSQAIYHRPPTPFASNSPVDTDRPPSLASCSCAARLLVLERDLEETKRSVARRDEEIVDLRRAITELRLATLRR